MSTQNVMRQVDALNDDLKAMTETFVRLVKSSRMAEHQQGATQRTDSALHDVLLEALISRSAAALDKIMALKRVLTLGNSDMHIHRKVSATVQQLHKATLQAQQSTLGDDPAQSGAHTLEPDQLLANTAMSQQAASRGMSAADCVDTSIAELAQQAAFAQGQR